MSAEIKSIINIGNINFKDIENFQKKLKKKELKSIEEYHKYINKKPYEEIEDDKYYEFLDKEKSKKYFKKTKMTRLFGSYETISFVPNFCIIHFYFSNLDFLNLKNERNIVRNMTKEITKALKGSSSLYVEEFNYIFDFVYPGYIEHVKNIDEAIIKLKENGCQEIPIDKYFDYFDDSYPNLREDYFFERFIFD